MTLAPPGISVLIAVRDGGRFLGEALASLAAQSFRDFEILLVDDGSRDETPALVEQWAAHEPRLRQFRLERAGLAACLNFAAAQARAPLLAKLDADDLARPQRLERQYRTMAERPSLGALGSAAELIDGAGRRLGMLSPPREHAAIGERLREGCPFVHSTAMIRSELFRSVGGYRPGLNLAEDYDLWIRLWEASELAALAEPLCGYRVHGGSLTSRQPARIALAAYCVAAAAEARRRALPEPFAGGVPCLGRAAALRGTGRAGAAHEVRLAARRAAISRAWLTLPVPASLRRELRRLALGLRLRPAYLALLGRLQPASRASARSGTVLGEAS